jgi:tetraacyldisaccharide 4'-kinase
MIRDRGSGERWIRSWWRGDAGAVGRLAHLVAAPVELLFRGGVRVRNALYDAGILPSQPGDLPVLSVGNLTVGGTGKTPVAAWLVGRLIELGAAPALVARGYGRDELLLHARWNPGVPVVAAARRWEGVRQAARSGADLVVVDDGFQHRKLRRDADIVLLAAETPFPGRSLPRGPYREQPRALRRADLVLVTRKNAPESAAAAVAARVAESAPHVPVARLRLVPAGWGTLSGGEGSPPPEPPLVVTGVAQPEGVRALTERELSRAPESLSLLAFPDHHEFELEDVMAIARVASGRPLVITEKDAVKLAEFPDALDGVGVHVLRLGLRWEAGEDALHALVARIVDGAG